MSSEQARGEEVDPRTDVWSLGVVLYEMLTGQLPFPGAHAEAIIHSILTSKPKPVTQLRGDAPVEIERIIHRTLEKDPKSRYTSAAEVLKDLTDYQSSLASPEMRLGGWKLISGWIRQRRVAIPGLVILLLLGSLLGWLFHRQARERWARDQGLPDISRLKDEQKYVAAFAIAQEAERYIPADPRLAKLWPALSRNVSIHTTPPGADVFMKEYTAIDDGWTYLGQSPLDRIRIPWGGLRLKVEKKGFVTAETPIGLWDVDTVSLVLDQDGRLPSGMVRVSSGATPISLTILGFEQLEPVELTDFWMDKYEVTNKEFKRFVDSDGYQNREHWKHAFLKEGRTLSWEEAMAEFHDATGRPGPVTWEAGDYPKGQEDYPVRGVSWYEAAAYAEFVGKSLPTIFHWNYVAFTSLSSCIVPLSNFAGQGPVRVGSFQGMSRSGAYDMARNVKEWCWNEADHHKRYILGGAWDEPVYKFCDSDAHPPSHRYTNFGFRCVILIRCHTLKNSPMETNETANRFWRGRELFENGF